QMGLAEEKEKTASTGAKQFSAQSSGTQPSLITFIDVCVGDGAFERFLDLPRFVQQFSKRVEVPSRCEDVAELTSDFAHPAKRGAMFTGICFLPVQPLAGRPRLARIKNDQAAVQFPLGLSRADYRIHADMSVRLKTNHLQAAVGGDILILLSDRLSESFDFHRARYCGLKSSLTLVPLEGVEGV